MIFGYSVATVLSDEVKSTLMYKYKGVPFFLSPLLLPSQLHLAMLPRAQSRGLRAGMCLSQGICESFSGRRKKLRR